MDFFYECCLCKGRVPATLADPLRAEAVKVEESQRGPMITYVFQCFPCHGVNPKSAPEVSEPV
jgi:hypothetical protein